MRQRLDKAKIMSSLAAGLSARRIAALHGYKYGSVKKAIQRERQRQERETEKRKRREALSVLRERYA